MNSLAIGIQYNGSAYCGWQRQPKQITVQGHLESALSAVAAETIELVCAGRTDSGVHAFAQVANFKTSAERSEQGWLLGANRHLPDDIAVTWVKTVAGDFSARFSASSRSYRYFIYNSKIRPALLANQVTWHFYPLDHELMQQAAQALIGEHDFSSFRAAACQSNTPMRNVTTIDVKRQGHLIVIDISANAFLHHMVRNIVGSLMVIGAGKKPVSWMAELLALKDRQQAAATALPHGLYLTDVCYPQQYMIPKPEVFTLPFD